MWARENFFNFMRTFFLFLFNNLSHDLASTFNDFIHTMIFFKYFLKIWHELKKNERTFFFLVYVGGWVMSVDDQQLPTEYWQSAVFVLTWYSGILREDKMKWNTKLSLSFHTAQLNFIYYSQFSQRSIKRMSGERKIKASWWLTTLDEHAHHRCGWNERENCDDVKKKVLSICLRFSRWKVQVSFQKRKKERNAQVNPFILRVIIRRSNTHIYHENLEPRIRVKIWGWWW